MTTTDLATVEDSLERSRADLEALAREVQGLTDVADVNEVRARVEAARAWAKVHGQLKNVRLQLLRVEVEALVRVVQLGGVDTLPAKDRKAAEWLAAMTPEQLAKVIEESGSSTTAAGMVRGIWRDEELEREKRLARFRGATTAEDPPAPSEDEEEAIKEARYHVRSAAAVLAELVSHYSEAGDAFTVAEMADELILEAGVGQLAAEDSAFREGVREVCREAVRRAPVFKVAGTVLPRVITARIDDGSYIRIPVANALMAHLDDMRFMRREQLAQDTAAVERLDRVAEKLRAIPGCSDQSRIGDLLAASLVTSEHEKDAAA